MLEECLRWIKLIYIRHWYRKTLMCLRINKSPTIVRTYWVNKLFWVWKLNFEEPSHKHWEGLGALRGMGVGGTANQKTKLPNNCQTYHQKQVRKHNLLDAIYIFWNYWQHNTLNFSIFTGYSKHPGILFCIARLRQLEVMCNLLPPCQRRQWHPTPVLLPGKSHGRRSLVGCSPWGRTESDTTEAT